MERVLVKDEVNFSVLACMYSLNPFILCLNSDQSGGVMDVSVHVSTQGATDRLELSTIGHIHSTVHDHTIIMNCPVPCFRV